MLLNRFSSFTREQVASLFEPGSYTRGSGSWGLHGIIELKNTPGDYVFFVTFGHTEGHHQFEESITQSGILTWQSQPTNKLSTTRIQRLIKHDSNRNTIYLFLRTTSRIEYTYLGNLAYLAHDQEREQPVYFQWQILDWNISEDVLQSMDLVLIPDKIIDSEEVVELNSIDQNVKQDKPKKIVFRPFKNIDFGKVDADNKKLGLSGEKWVLSEEKRMLTEIGKPNLASKVKHISLEEGDGLGYDILSFTPDGHEIFIEVKTTRGNINTEFYLSINEWERYNEAPDKYFLYRVFEFDESTNQGVLKIINSLEKELHLSPKVFKAKIIGI